MLINPPTIDEISDARALAGSAAAGAVIGAIAGTIAKHPGQGALLGTIAGAGTAAIERLRMTNISWITSESVGRQFAIQGGAVGALTTAIASKLDEDAVARPIAFGIAVGAASIAGRYTMAASRFYRRADIFHDFFEDVKRVAPRNAAVTQIFGTAAPTKFNLFR